MAEKKYRGAPFGVQTARFDVSSAHPDRKLPGSFVQAPYHKQTLDDYERSRGPGKYRANTGDFTAEPVATRARGPGWQRALEMELFAQTPHLLYKEDWEKKQLQKRSLGPGTYTLPDSFSASERRPTSTRGILATRDTRFKGDNRNLPPPGSYGEGGIPQSAIEEKAKISPGNIGLLDNSGRVKGKPEGSGLAPGTYATPNSSIDLLLDKVVSLRGPYDSFSADRAAPISTGHRAASKSAYTGDGKAYTDHFMDKFSNNHRKKHGKFGKISQYPGHPTERIVLSDPVLCYKDPNAPGPGYHNPTKIEEAPTGSHIQNAPPFLTSATRENKKTTQWFNRNFNAVGVGRYDVTKYGDAQHKNGCGSSFMSKSQKPDEQTYKLLCQRVRPRNVRLDTKRFLVSPVKANDAIRRVPATS